MAVAAREETERSEGSKGICTVTGPILLKLVKLTHENIEKEHICCAISNNKDIQVMSKKNWLKDRLDEGLVFLKGNVRGKCFIEYIPAEYDWYGKDRN